MVVDHTDFVGIVVVIVVADVGRNIAKQEKGWHIPQEADGWIY